MEVCSKKKEEEEESVGGGGWETWGQKGYVFPPQNLIGGPGKPYRFVEKKKHILLSRGFGEERDFEEKKSKRRV